MSPRETQPQRTAPAWQRTGLGVLGGAALLGHAAVVVTALAAAAAVLSR
ncbi:hypothetical protein [Geodermatophilus amargosae]